MSRFSNTQKITPMLFPLASPSSSCHDLMEHDRLDAVQENLALGVPLDGRRQHLALDVGPGLRQVARLDGVVDPGDALLDDGTLVQVGGHKVRGRADDLDAALVGLVVGLGALERRQEGVVDVDDAAGHGGAELGGQDLHVPRQHDELDAVLGDEVQDGGLLLGLGVLCHGEVVEGDAVRLCELGVLRVVGHDQRHLDAELAGLHAEQQVVEAVADLGHHDEDARLPRDGPNVVGHLILGRELVEGLGEVRRVRLGDGAKVHAHEEPTGGRVGELLQVQDVVLVQGEDTGDGVDDAGLVRAGQREDVVIGHVESRRQRRPG